MTTPNPYAAVHAARAAGAIESWRRYEAAPDRVTVVALCPDGTVLTGEGVTLEAALVELRWRIEALTREEPAA